LKQDLVCSAEEERRGETEVQKRKSELSSNENRISESSISFIIKADEAFS